MNEIETWKYNGEWRASRMFASDLIISRYSVTTLGVGKTKEEAINSLCDALMSLSKEIREVVYEVNLNR